MGCFNCGKFVKGMRLGIDPRRRCFVHLCPECKDRENKTAVLKALAKRRGK